MAGSVVLTDVISEPTTTGYSGGNGLMVRGIAVHASRCVFGGGFRSNGSLSILGDSGAIVDGGALFVADACQIRGGSCLSTAPENHYLTGGNGLTVLAATAHLTRTDLTGGPAGIQTFPRRTFKRTVVQGCVPRATPTCGRTARRPTRSAVA